ncbi:MAG: plasmid partition protein ParG [Acidobacteriota bacterium]
MSPIITVNNEEVKRMNLNVPVELHNAFKAATAARGQNMTDILLEFIQSYVDKHAPKQTKGRRK